MPWKNLCIDISGQIKRRAGKFLEVGTRYRLVHCSGFYRTSTMIFPLTMKSRPPLDLPMETECSPILIVGHLMMSTLDLCPRIHLWNCMSVSDGIRRAEEYTHFVNVSPYRATSVDTSYLIDYITETRANKMS